MCSGVEGTVVAVSAETIDVLTSSGKRTCLWTSAELPKVGDRVLTFANLGLGVVPDGSAIELERVEEA
jgi:hypothetical protein